MVNRALYSSQQRRNGVVWKSLDGLVGSVTSPSYTPFLLAGKVDFDVLINNNQLKPVKFWSFSNLQCLNSKNNFTGRTGNPGHIRAYENCHQVKFFSSFLGQNTEKKRVGDIISFIFGH
jgi:hypothetical protein